MAYQPRNVYWLWLSALVIFADQVTKQMIARSLRQFDVRPVLPHLNLVHMKNTGAAFSMFSSARPEFFILLGTAVAVGILWWMRRHPDGQRLMACALALILGGALGNVIDRVMRGYVVDFIDFYIGSWHFAAFNLADSAISLGAGFLILDMVLDGRRTRDGAAAGGGPIG